MILPLLHISPYFTSERSSEGDYRMSAGKQVSAAPCEEVAMTPGADMWASEASFAVTWRPTF